MAVKRLILAIVSLCGAAFAQYPVTDSFSGSGALSGNWTTPLLTSGANNTFNQFSGYADCHGAFASCFAAYTGVTFTAANQYAQAVIDVDSVTSGASPGVCVNLSSSGGYCLVIFSVSAGIGTLHLDKYNSSGTATFLATCSGTVTIGSGATIKLAIAGTALKTFLAGSGTQDSACSLTDTTYTTGNPGMVSILGGATSTIQIQSFQADCYPTTCGGGGAALHTLSILGAGPG